MNESNFFRVCNIIKFWNDKTGCLCSVAATRKPWLAKSVQIRLYANRVQPIPWLEWGGGVICHSKLENQLK